MVDIHQTILPNGIRVVLCPDNTVPLVGVSAFYDVGSRIESEGCSGYAHLLEHLMFQGSEHVVKGDFIRRIHDLGGHANGSPSRERTNFYMSLPAHEVGLGLWMEADRLRSLHLSREHLDNQRETVLEERLQRVDSSPYGEAQIRINELSYSQFAYAHPVIGYRPDLESVDLESIQAFFSTWYRPENVVLSVVGDVDLDHVLDLIHECFGSVLRGDRASQPNLTESKRMQTSVHRMTERLTTMPALYVNHQSVPYGDPDFFVYEVIETLLFRGPSSRLIRKMVIEDSHALQLTGGYEAHRGPSLFSFFAVLPDGGSPTELADQYQAELERLVAEPVSDEELEKVCNQLRANRIFGREVLIGRATALARSLTYHNDVHWEDRYLERIGRVSAADIQRVAARDFDPNGRVILEVYPS